jgi:hypothetical protein
MMVIHRFGVAARVLGGALGVIALAGSAGCSRDLRIDAGDFDGPPVRIDSAGDWHVVVGELPSPGWEFVLDRTRPTPDAERVFLSMRRPNPMAVYPMVIVEQRVVTPVRSNGAIEAFARVVGYADKKPPGYRRVRLAPAPGE